MIGRVVGKLRAAGRGARTGAALARDLAVYAGTGRTSLPALQRLIDLHCLTRGWSNDALHALVRVARPGLAIEPRGVLGDLSAAELDELVGRLRRHGHAVLPGRLPEPACAALERHALERPGRLPGVGKPLIARYDRAAPPGETFKLDERDVVDHEAVQALMADASLLALAQGYLGCAPVLDGVTMWWSAPRAGGPSAEAAQLFHFDMDRIKWLKLFVYVTDVGPTTGPHCVVDGSHRAGAQPRSLLRRGYARLSDEEIAGHYSADRIVEVCAPRGTLIAVDTRAFHKGKPPTTGDRLVLQLQWSDCLFGSSPSATPIRPRDAALEEAVRRWPAVYVRFPIEGEP